MKEALKQMIVPTQIKSLSGKGQFSKVSKSLKFQMMKEIHEAFHQSLDSMRMMYFQLKMPTT